MHTKKGKGGSVVSGEALMPNSIDLLIKLCEVRELLRESFVLARSVFI